MKRHKLLEIGQRLTEISNEIIRGASRELVPPECARVNLVIEVGELDSSKWSRTYHSGDFVIDLRCARVAVSKPDYIANEAREIAAAFEADLVRILTEAAR